MIISFLILQVISIEPADAFSSLKVYITSATIPLIICKEPESQNVRRELEKTFHRAREGRRRVYPLCQGPLALPGVARSEGGILSVRVVLSLLFFFILTEVKKHLKNGKNISKGFGFLDFESVDTAVKVCRDLQVLERAEEGKSLEELRAQTTARFTDFTKLLKKRKNVTVLVGRRKC
ncbi:unnamed protein product [Fraxinus pennsylvanica]|uniref:RRM domain-containing protein n=1 Tax=Fraxinus pennsylvanica TaxID=56036 RepID=A0AAD1YN80_9LAMI|nr:unnamed protein product [Fraxinus pennsylvanica]